MRLGPAKDERWNEFFGLDSSINPFDSWKSLSISLYMTLAGYAVLVGVPVISTAWVNLLGFSEVQVGRVAGADLGGLSVGALATSFIISKASREQIMLIGTFIAVLFGWLVGPAMGVLSLGAICSSLLMSNASKRQIIIFGILIACTSNAACISITSYEYTLWLRFLAGFGSGLITATAVSCLGASSRPALAFNAMLFAFAFSQYAELEFLPMLSMQNIYITFIVCFLIIVPFLGWVPNDKNIQPTINPEVAKPIEESKLSKDNLPKYVIWLCLSGIAITYVNIGAYWTYIEIAAASDNTDPKWVGSVLAWSSFFSFVGCLFATLLSNKFGLLRPLLVTLVCQASIVGMLANGVTNTNILISVFSFNCLWIFIDVYQMSTIANFDKIGKYASLMPGAQGLGQIIGPYSASYIIGLGLGYSAVFIMCAMASLIAMLIYAFIFLKFKSRRPELAYAT